MTFKTELKVHSFEPGYGLKPMIAARTDGTGKGDEIQVNAFTDSFQLGSAIAATEVGEWGITRRSNTQSGEAFGVYSRVFAPLATGDLTIPQTDNDVLPRFATSPVTVKRALVGDVTNADFSF